MVPDNIADKLILGADAARRAAVELKTQGKHQQAAVQRERAKTMELVLTWIDNGLPVRKPALSK